jgi:hypothetical protein
MNINPKELASVAAAQQPRMDMYGGIHKALRAFMADTLLAVGRMDADDALEVGRTTEQVLALLEACASHLKHENAFVHTAIEARAAGGSEAIAHEHDEHLLHIEALAGTVAAVRACPQPALRMQLAAQLYAKLALFVADNFHHMHVEETAHNALLWARYTDAELMAIHDALVASIPPDEMMKTARWLVPFMNPQERAMLLGDMRAKAPAPAFQALMDVVQPHLSTHEWAKLARALGMAPVPGLVQA